MILHIIFLSCTILALFFIAALYFLSPDGTLRKIRITFYITLGAWFSYQLLLVFSEVFELWVITEGMQSLIITIKHVVGCFLALWYAYAMNTYYQRLKRPKQRINVSFDVMALRLSADLCIQWIDDLSAVVLLAPPADLYGKHFSEILHQDSAATINELNKYINDVENFTPQTYIIKFVRHDNTHRLGKCVVSKSTNGVSLRVGLQDITEQAQGQALLESLKLAMDSVQNIGLTISSLMTRKIIYVNRHDAELHGYTQEELIGESVLLYAPPFLIDGEIRDDLSEVYVSLNKSRDGTIFPVRLRVTVNKELQLRIVFCECITHITPKDSLLLEDSRLLLFVVDFSYNLRWMNKNASSLLRYSTKEQSLPRLKELFSGEVFTQFITNAGDEEVHNYTMSSRGESIPIYLISFKGVGYYSFIGRPKKGYTEYLGHG